MEIESSGEPGKAPFFIVGAQRSGTTLLRLMLAAHPRLAIPPESHFVPDLMAMERRSGGLVRSRQEVIEWLVAHARLADFELGAEYLRSALASLEPFDTRTITAALFSEYARRQGKARWGDKTPRYREFIPDLHFLFPEGLFIHVLRDGRDTALSASRAAFNNRVPWIEVCYRWRDSVRAAWRGSRSLPRGHYMELHYEDLLRAPGETLTQVCKFLGEEFDPDMLRFSERADKLVPSWEKAWHSKLEQPLDPKNLEKWRTELAPKDIFVLQYVAGRELRSAGYAMLPISVGPTLYATTTAQQVWYLVKGLALRSARLGRSRSASPPATTSGPRSKPAPVTR